MLEQRQEENIFKNIPIKTTGNARMRVRGNPNKHSKVVGYQVEKMLRS